MAENKLFLTVRSQEGVAFEEDVLSVTGRNDKGVFDVLPSHANFITLLRGKLIVKKPDRSEQEIPAENGVLRVLRNKVDVYIGLK